MTIQQDAPSPRLRPGPARPSPRPRASGRAPAGPVGRALPPLLAAALLLCAPLAAQHPSEGARPASVATSSAGSPGDPARAAETPESAELVEAARALAEATRALEAALRARSAGAAGTARTAGPGGGGEGRAKAEGDAAASAGPDAVRSVAVELARAAETLSAAAGRIAGDGRAEVPRAPAGDEGAGREQEAGVRITSGAAEIDLGGRVQVQSVTSSCASSHDDGGSPCAGDAPGLDLFARRVRLTADIRFSDLLDARIQPDFGEVSGSEVKDAWGRLTFDPALRVKFGRFKRPFDGFQLLSSTRTLTIERDLDVPGVPGLRAASLDELTTRFGISDRDIGLMVDGTLADRFTYALGVFNGESGAANGDMNTKKQFVGRTSYRTSVGTLPLTLAGAAAFTDLPSRSPDGELGGEYFHNFEAWVEVGDFGGGPHVQAGAVFGENPLQSSRGEPIQDPDAASFADMFTWQLIASYRAALGDGEGVAGILEAVEPVFRITQANPNTDLGDDVVWGLTPGLQLFFGGRNKLALNWDVVLFEDDLLDSENSFKAQYQFHF